MKSFIYSILFFLPIFLLGQSELPPNVAYKVDYMGLDYFHPLEQKFKFKKGERNRYFSYDMKMIDRKLKQEIFVILTPERTEDDIVKYPHIEFTRLLAGLATNEQDVDIMVVTHDTRKLNHSNADWGSESYFTIKEQISRYPHAKLFSFYKEGKGLVSILYCFNNPDYLPKLFAFQETMR